MLISLFRYIQGYLKIRVTGYSPERFLNLCKNKKIDIWELESSGNAYQMYMKVSGFRKLKGILKKTRTRVVIEERFGLPFFFYRYRKRTFFFGGCILCMALIYSLTFFVWDIEFEGNQRITDEVLLEYLETKHVRHGMAKSQVSCSQIVKDIRKDFDDIIWVSASMEGSNLYIHVKENTDTFEMDEMDKEPCDLVADKSGIVVSIVTRSGVPKVSVGSEVKEGDVLVSGTVDVLNDAKEVVSHRYVAADADIIIQTSAQYEDSISKEYIVKTYTKKKRTLLFVAIDKYCLQLGFSRESFKNKEYRTEQTRLKLGDSFELPLIVGKKQILEYSEKTMEYSKEEMETLLRDKFERYCRELEEKGLIITSRDLSVTHLNDGAKAVSVMTLLEEVGIQRKIVDF